MNDFAELARSIKRRRSLREADGFRYFTENDYMSHNGYVWSVDDEGVGTRIHASETVMVYVMDHEHGYIVYEDDGAGPGPRMSKDETDRIYYELGKIGLPNVPVFEAKYFDRYEDAVAYAVTLIDADFFSY